jgi:hypothetical protein
MKVQLRHSYRWYGRESQHYRSKMTDMTFNRLTEQHAMSMQ